MKILVSLVLLMAMLCGCGIFRKESNDCDICGFWYGFEMQDSLFVEDVNGIYEIFDSKGYVIVPKGNPDYSFSHIHLTDNNFTFRMIDSSDKADITEYAFNMYLNELFTIMSGSSYSSKGVEVKVEWRRER